MRQEKRRSALSGFLTCYFSILCSPNPLSSARKPSLIPCTTVTEGSPVFCGKCGTPNPADNGFCRKCGHHLEDDVVEEGSQQPIFPNASPISPVDGISIDRYPLLDPETGEEIPPIATTPEVTPAKRAASQPSRGSLVFRSLGVHLASISLLGITAMIVLSQLGYTPEPESIATFQSQAEDLRQRLENNQISSEEAENEGRRLLEQFGLARLLLLLSGPTLLAFFVAGLITGRLWRPQRLLEVGLAGLLIGGLCSLCLISPMVWPAALGLSLLGTIVGKRWGS